jgi:hypothetical protein
LGFGDNGVTLAGEVHYHVNRDSRTPCPGPTRWAATTTGDFQNIASVANATDTGNAMGCWRIRCSTKRPAAGAGLWGFGALVFSFTNDVNPMTWYSIPAWSLKGSSRAGRRTPRGWPSPAAGSAIRSTSRATGRACPEKDYEAVIELNHQFVLGHGSASSRTFIIIRPAATGDIDNALAIGARVSVTF